MIDDDVLELAELPQPAPRSRWNLRHTATLAGALSLFLVAAVVIALLPRPLPPADLIGLRAPPAPVWRTTLGPRQVATAAGAETVVVHDTFVTDRPAEVRGLDAETGRELWRAEVDDQGYAPPLPLVVRDLPGTSWVAMQVGPVVHLVDRRSGREIQRLTLPPGRPSRTSAATPWFGSTDRGTLIMAVPDTVDGRDVVTVSRLGSPNPADVLWSTGVPITRSSTLGVTETALVEREGVLLAPARTTWRGSDSYSLALRVADGGAPGWTGQADQFVVSRSNAVLSGKGFVAGYDLASGAEVWRLEPAAARLYAAGDVLIVESMGELRRLDPRSGRTRWSSPAGTTFTDLMVTDDVLVIYDGAQTIFPDSGTGAFDAPGRWIKALDIGSGTQRWRTDLPTPVIDAMLGEEQLVVRMFDPTQDGATPLFEVAALRPSDGRVQWRWDSGEEAWTLGRLGPRLASVGPDDVLTVWG